MINEISPKSVTIVSMPSSGISESAKNFNHDDRSDSVYLHHITLESSNTKKSFNEIQRPLLKITNIQKGISIYRKYRQGSNLKVQKDQIILTNRDLKFIQASIGDALEIKPANSIGVFKYYYYNPQQEIRIAARFALWAFLLSLLFSLITKAI